MSNKKQFILAILLITIIFTAINVYAADKKDDQTMSLAQGISLILKDSRLIKAAFYDAQMAKDDQKVSQSGLLPQINLFAQQTFLQYQPGSKLNGQTINTGQKSFLSAGLDVYQTLFDFGKTVAQYKAAGQMLDARQASLENVRRLAVLEFVLAYFDFLEAKKMVVVAKKELNSLFSYCSDIERLYEQGVVVKNDLLPAQVKLAAAKQQLINSRSNLTSFRLKLNVLLNRPLLQVIDFKESNMDMAKLPVGQQAWDMALKDRMEIKFIDSQIKASGFQQKFYADENKPVLFAQAGYQHDQNKYQAHESNGSLVLGVKTNIFDGGNADALTKKERDQQLQLLEQRQILADDIQLEIENNYLSLKDAQEKLKVAQKALDQAQENVRMSRIKYSEGAATTTEMLEAIALRTQAQTNYYNAQYNLNRGYARIMYSLGKDLAGVYGAKGE